jgi:hypothetical protein
MVLFDEKKEEIWVQKIGLKLLPYSDTIPKVDAQVNFLH